MIYPKWYYCRAGVSDKKFILERISVIPDSKQQEVSDEYERMYLKNGHVKVAEARREANTWLHNIARGYQKERSPEAYQRHMDKMKEMTRTDKKSDTKYQACTPPENKSTGKLMDLINEVTKR